MDKNAKIKEKVSRGLYKQILFVQERPSIQKVCDSTSCDLVCFYLDSWQAWSNATKREQGKITFADAVAFLLFNLLGESVVYHYGGVGFMKKACFAIIQYYYPPKRHKGCNVCRENCPN